MSKILLFLFFSRLFFLSFFNSFRKPVIFFYVLYFSPLSVLIFSEPQFSKSIFTFASSILYPRNHHCMSSSFCPSPVPRYSSRCGRPFLNARDFCRLGLLYYSGTSCQIPPAAVGEWSQNRLRGYRHKHNVMKHCYNSLHVCTPTKVLSGASPSHHHTSLCLQQQTEVADDQIL